jgi:hypothetical protein
LIAQVPAAASLTKGSGAINASGTQSGTVGGTQRSQNKTLTKKKLQEFDEANLRETPHQTTNQRTQKFLSKGTGATRKLSGDTLSDDGEEAVRELLSVIKRAHEAAVYPPKPRLNSSVRVITNPQQNIQVSEDIQELQQK